MEVVRFCKHAHLLIFLVPHIHVILVLASLSIVPQKARCGCWLYSVIFRRLKCRVWLDFVLGRLWCLDNSHRVSLILDDYYLNFWLDLHMNRGILFRNNYLDLRRSVEILLKFFLSCASLLEHVVQVASRTRLIPRSTPCPTGFMIGVLDCLPRSESRKVGRRNGVD